MTAVKSMPSRKALQIVREGTYADLSPNTLLSELEVAQFFGDIDATEVIELELKYRERRSISREAFVRQMEQK